MFQYFISEINIDKITNTTIEKLKEKFEFNESVENIIYSREGYYVIKDNTVTLFKINHKENFKEEFFLDKYTLFGNNNYIKKIENINKLPVHYTPFTV